MELSVHGLRKAMLLAGSIAGGGRQAQADSSASTTAPLDAGHPHLCYTLLF